MAQVKLPLWEFKGYQPTLAPGLDALSGIHLPSLPRVRNSLGIMSFASVSWEALEMGTSTPPFLFQGLKSIKQLLILMSFGGILPVPYLALT